MRAVPLRMACLVVGLAALWSLVAAKGSLAADGNRPPNIVFILADDK